MCPSLPLTTKMNTAVNNSSIDNNTNSDNKMTARTIKISFQGASATSI